MTEPLDKAGYRVRLDINIDIKRIIRRKKRPDIVLMDKDILQEIVNEFLVYAPLESAAYIFFENDPPFLISLDWWSVEEYETRSHANFSISSEEIMKASMMREELQNETGKDVVKVRCHFHNGSLNRPSGGDREEFESREKYLSHNIEGIMAEDERLVSFFRYENGSVKKMPTLTLDSDETLALYGKVL